MPSGLVIERVQSSCIITIITVAFCLCCSAFSTLEHRPLFIFCELRLALLPWIAPFEVLPIPPVELVTLRLDEVALSSPSDLDDLRFEAPPPRDPVLNPHDVTDSKLRPPLCSRVLSLLCLSLELYGSPVRVLDLRRDLWPTGALPSLQ